MRRSQAAVEYLFMLALALLVVAMVVCAVLEVAEEGGRMVEREAREIGKELNETLREVLT